MVRECGRACLSAGRASRRLVRSLFPARFLTFLACAADARGGISVSRYVHECPLRVPTVEGGRAGGRVPRERVNARVSPELARLRRGVRRGGWANEKGAAAHTEIARDVYHVRRS